MSISRDSYAAGTRADFQGVGSGSVVPPHLRKIAELLYQSSGRLLDLPSLLAQHPLDPAAEEASLDALIQDGHFISLQPLHGGGRRECSDRIKIFGTDLDAVRQHQPGISKDALWRHEVLRLLREVVPAGRLRFWRDFRNRSIDFVVLGPRAKSHDIIICAATSDAGLAHPVVAFRHRYPRGRNLLLLSDPHEPESTYRHHAHDITTFGSSLLPRLITGSEAPSQ